MFSVIFHPKTLCLRNLTGRRANIIRDGLRNTIKVNKIFFIGVTVSLVLYAGYPLYFFVFEGQLVPLTPLEIMFVDQVIVMKGNVPWWDHL